MQNPDGDKVAEAAVASWGYRLGEDVQLAYEDDDGVSEAEGGVWIKAWLWIPDEDLIDEEEQ